MNSITSKKNYTLSNNIMNSKNFKNYEEFKELFVREDGKRKNGILLSFLKEKGVRDLTVLII